MTDREYKIHERANLINMRDHLSEWEDLALDLRFKCIANLIHDTLTELDSEIDFCNTWLEGSEDDLK